MNDRPKIAIVTGGLGFGGSTTFVLQLALGLRTTGVPSAVFSFRNEHAFAEEFAAAGIPAHSSDQNRFIFEDRLTALYKKIAEFNPTAVIANIGSDSYEMLRYMPSGVARVGMVHDSAMQPARLILTYQHDIDGVAAVNRFLAEDVRRSVPGVNCRYIAHGIPLSKLPPRSANPSGPLKIIYFGRLAVGKGTRFFPGIADDLQKRNVPFQFTIHGNGPDEAWLREALARHVASGAVVFSSNVPRSELYPLIRQHDIFIMASEVEGGPLTLLEAMSLGLVPVCNDIPCLVQEVINSENGFCISRSPEKYAEVIAGLHNDRPRLERLSVAARKTIGDDYSIEAMTKRYLSFLESLPLEKKNEWPARIRPQPILGSSGAVRIGQSLGILRQTRRFLKYLRAAT